MAPLHWKRFDIRPQFQSLVVMLAENSVTQALMNSRLRLVLPVSTIGLRTRNDVQTRIISQIEKIGKVIAAGNAGEGIGEVGIWHSIFKGNDKLHPFGRIDHGTLLSQTALRD